MWSTLSFDLLAHIFSFLPPNSLAIASLSCRTWHSCVKAYPLCKRSLVNQSCSSCFITFSSRNRTFLSYVYSPVSGSWHRIVLDSLHQPAQPIAPIGSLLLFSPTSSTSLQLGLWNPFTRQHIRCLPMLNIARTKPAIGIIELDPTQQAPYTQFQLYVAGGMCEAPSGGASYEPTLEVYNSRCNNWRIVGPMPMEFAVRLTVWTPNECVYCNGSLYWITSSRAYSIMSYGIKTKEWKELNVPMADRIVLAALVRRNGRMTLVGGTCDGSVLIWELSEGELWVLVEALPDELGKKLLGVTGSWATAKCVGNDGAVWLYRDLWSGMVVWREVGEKGMWEWVWVEGCCSIRGKLVQNCSIRAVLLNPSLAHSFLLGK